MKYTLFHNVDKYDRDDERNRGNWRGEHQSWHRLTPYYTDTIDVAADPIDTAWVLFRKHNQDSRPCGQLGPSFSTGDVIVFEPADGPKRALALTDDDYVEVPVLTTLDLTYLEWLATE